MKPKKVTVEGEIEEKRKALCDEILYRAANMMVEHVGAKPEMMLDRFITFSAAHSCKFAGSPATADMFREVAKKVEGGVFHSVTGEGKRH
jgi:hypothetical protein